MIMTAARSGVGDSKYNGRLIWMLWDAMGSVAPKHIILNWQSAAARSEAHRTTYASSGRRPMLNGRES